MTLNQTINRIQTISEAHLQVASFQKGIVQDFLTDQTTRYPAVFLQDNGGRVSLTGHATTLNYRMFIMDLVHVSQDSKDNEQDVQSDMVSIAQDILAQMNNPNYTDWAISTDNALQLVIENDNDLHAGCIIDFSIRIMFEQDRCKIPSDIVVVNPENERDMSVYDTIYTAIGNEGVTLDASDDTKPTLNVINGKKVLFITRENNPLFKVSSSPNSSQYVWNDTVITLNASVPARAGERFLILYRNY